MKKIGNIPFSLGDFEQIFQALPTPFLIILPDDPNFTIAEANDAYLDTTFTTRDQIVGKPLFTVFPDNPDDPGANGVLNLSASLRQVISTQQPHRMEAQKYDIRNHATGEFLIRFWNAVNIPVVEHGNILYIVHHVQDITDNILVEQANALRDANAMLEKSNRDLEQFAYVASHDLQEPLRKVKAFGDMLKNRYMEVIGSEGADLIGRMQSATDRMQTLIDDLLSYSRVSSRRQTFQEIDLNKLVSEVIDDLDTAIKSKNATIKVDKLQPVQGDAGQLRQMFQNLISNALKFTRPDVPPVISISSSLDIGLDTGFDLPEKQAKKLFQLIEVRDNGIGFEQQYAEKIFGIFQRLHGRTEYAGSGVGLSIVKKVVEQHQGHIRAESTLNEGASFKMIFPVVRPAVG